MMPPDGLTKEQRIAAKQEAARRPTPCLTLAQATEWTLVKAYGFPNSAIVGVCQGGDPIFSEGTTYVFVHWYWPGDDAPNPMYEDLTGLELAPASTPYPHGCIPF